MRNFSPPAEIERRHVSRELKGTSEVEDSFSEAVFVFSDGTFDEFAEQLRSRSAGRGAVHAAGERIAAET